MQKITFILLLLAGCFDCTAQSKLKLHFSAEKEIFQKDAIEYEKIWKEHGDEIVMEMEKQSGLKFMDTVIKVSVYGAMSLSGEYAGTEMKLKGSYPYETKKGTLIHELGHRLNFALNKPAGYDEHPFLFCYLYDVWANLFGKEFADSQVNIESKRKGYYDYETAWKKILSLTKEQRTEKIKNEISQLGINKM